MIDVAPFVAVQPPALIAPELHTVKKRRNRSRTRDTSRSWTGPALFVGAVLVLSDGSTCEVVAVHPELLCRPLPVTDD